MKFSYITFGEYVFFLLSDLFDSYGSSILRNTYLLLLDPYEVLITPFS